MTLGESLLAEFDHEMAVTRRVLDRVPDNAFGWKPHDKSYSLGELASHLAQLPHWGTQILERESYDLNTAGKRESKPSLQAVLETFDHYVMEVRRTLSRSTDAELQAPWLLKRGTQVLMSVPRNSALRSFLISHVIHHRGQMTVYLRLQGVPLPPIYGPTADEGM